MQLQKLQDLYEESQLRQGTKCHRSAKNASPILELATPKKQLTDSQGELRDAYQDSRSALKDLLLHTVGHYEAKTPAGTKVLFAARAQASLGWLVLNANQLESSPSRPGSIAIAGDFQQTLRHSAPTICHKNPSQPQKHSEWSSKAYLGQR